MIDKNLQKQALKDDDVRLSIKWPKQTGTLAKSTWKIGNLDDNKVDLLNSWQLRTTLSEIQKETLKDFESGKTTLHDLEKSFGHKLFENLIEALDLFYPFDYTIAKKAQVASTESDLDKVYSKLKEAVDKLKVKALKNKNVYKLPEKVTVSVRFSDGHKFENYSMSFSYNEFTKSYALEDDATNLWESDELYEGAIDEIVNAAIDSIKFVGDHFRPGEPA